MTAASTAACTRGSLMAGDSRQAFSCLALAFGHDIPAAPRNCVRQSFRFKHRIGTLGGVPGNAEQVFKILLTRQRVVRAVLASLDPGPYPVGDLHMRRHRPPLDDLRHVHPSYLAEGLHPPAVTFDPSPAPTNTCILSDQETKSGPDGACTPLPGPRPLTRERPCPHHPATTGPQ